MTDPELAQSLSEVGRGMQDLAAAFQDSLEHDRIDREEKAKALQRGRHQWYLFITAVMGLLLISVVTFGTINYRALQTANDSNRRVEDCTLPTGTCYKRKASATLKNNAAIVAGLDADNQKAIDELVQDVCNLDTRACQPGMTPQPK